jgi:hypothetical protein
VGVSRMFQGYFKDVSRVFQGCYKGVTRVNLVCPDTRQAHKTQRKQAHAGNGRQMLQKAGKSYVHATYVITSSAVFMSSSSSSGISN